MACVLSVVVESFKDLFLLDQKAEVLAKEMELLQDISKDVESMAYASGRLKSQVRDWLHSVEQLAEDVADFQRAFDRSGTGCLYSSCYKLPCRAAQYMARIRELKAASSELGVLAGEAVPDTSPIVGREDTLSAIRNHLRSDLVRVIGICGMGGVGKTTLLRRINNELLVAGGASAFDVVILVYLSRDPAIQKIQHAIGVQLGLHFSVNQGGSSQTDVEEQAKILFKALLKRRFLLLLDDMWEAIDLMALGIPHPSYHRNSKIVIASRSIQVCAAMDADVIVNVCLLNMEQSWKLFRRSVGAEVDLWSPPITSLAKIIVHRCGGLPLALATIGRALSNARTVTEWEHAVRMFTESSNGLPGMEEFILSPLKLSFDRLEDDLQQCLLYFSLFPEDYNVHIEELIEYWIGEGLLDNTWFPDDIDLARNRGHSVIKSLKTACFLESGDGDNGDMYVKMHDIIRDMILWIISREDYRSVNLAGRKLSSHSNVKEWHDALRISLMDCEIEDFPELPHCPNLETLLLKKNAHLIHIPHTFFSVMPKLRVLDLSSTRIEELPNEIGMLIELRYLNLSDTTIRLLPMHIGKLQKLEQLNLGYTRELVTIPQKAMLALGKLQKLNLYNSAYYWTSKANEYEERGLILKDLELLDGLNDLRLDVKLLPILDEILKSKRLSRAIRYLTLQHVKNLSILPPDFSAMNNLQELCIDECSSLQELTFSNGQLCSLEVLLLLGLSITKVVIQETALQSLRNLHILGCHMLKDLTPIHQLPCLERIDLRVCNGLKELISAPLDEDSVIFPQLRSINLYALPSFERISWHPLFLPCLECLEVYGCPMFMKLPLDSHSAKNIKQILGMQKWWEALEWDEKSTRLRFLPFFKNSWQEEKEKDDEGEEEAEDMSKRRQEYPGDGGSRETTY